MLMIISFLTQLGKIPQQHRAPWPPKVAIDPAPSGYHFRRVRSWHTLPPSGIPPLCRSPCGSTTPCVACLIGCNLPLEKDHVVPAAVPLLSPTVYNLPEGLTSDDVLDGSSPRFFWRCLQRSMSPMETMLTSADLTTASWSRRSNKVSSLQGSLLTSMTANYLISHWTK